MALTNTAAKNAKAKDKPYKLADGDGMFLLVKSNGLKYWRFKYRFGDKEKLLALGVYPDVTLIDARKQRDHARELLRGGIDPGHAKQEKKALDKLGSSQTFEAIAREWHENKRDGWQPNTAADKLNRLEKDVFPYLGTNPIASITPPQVLMVLRRVESRGALELSRRLKQTIGQVFRYAVATGRAERDPTQDLKDALKPMQHGHFAAIEVKELPAFMAALERNEARLFMQTRLALRLMMLTFVRTSELIEAEWSEFDLDAASWEIPKERMKRRRPHLVPLSKQAVRALRELHALTGNNRYLFSNQRDHEKPMSNGAILMALRRMGYQGKMTGHGFRALAMSTIKEKLGYRHEVIDMQLAHAKENKVQAAYDRAQFIADRTRMMQRWADYLDAVATGGKVVTGQFGRIA
jgi:integrase